MRRGSLARLDHLALTLLRGLRSWCFLTLAGSIVVCSAPIVSVAAPLSMTLPLCCCCTHDTTAAAGSAHAALHMPLAVVSSAASLSLCDASPRWSETAVRLLWAAARPVTVVREVSATQRPRDTTRRGHRECTAHCAQRIRAGGQLHRRAAVMPLREFAQSRRQLQRQPQRDDEVAAECGEHEQLQRHCEGQTQHPRCDCFPRATQRFSSAAAVRVRSLRLSPSLLFPLLPSCLPAWLPLARCYR